VGRYRARDLVNAPTLVSWLRLPLAAVFPLVRERPVLSLVVLAAAGLTDIIDGFIARRWRLATPTGAVVDGVTDKLFVGAVLATLLATDKLAVFDVLLLGARELGELPLVVWLLLSPEARKRKVDDRANVFGKAATTLQFGVVVLTLLASPLLTVGLWLAGMVGLAAALSYWFRALARARMPVTPRPPRPGA
jgi:cardiolipin synthase (CMP-forming)